MEFKYKQGASTEKGGRSLGAVNPFAKKKEDLIKIV